MVTERQTLETVARCVSTMVFYHNGDRTGADREPMSSEVRLIAGFVAEWDLDADETEGLIIRPVEAELIARYGREIGPRLVREFADAFGLRKA